MITMLARKEKALIRQENDLDASYNGIIENTEQKEQS